MPRLLSDDHNKLKIHDNISNSEMVLFYRTPTSQENTQYTNEVTVRKRNRIVSRLGETRQKYGAEILTGFRDGDFVRKNERNEIVPIASDPDSPNYYPEWKDLVREKASDLIEALAIHVFESSVETEDGEVLEKNLETISEPTFRGSATNKSEQSAKPSVETEKG